MKHFKTCAVLGLVVGELSPQSTTTLPFDLRLGNNYSTYQPLGHGHIIGSQSQFDASPLIVQQVYESGHLRGRQVMALQFRAFVPPSGVPSLPACSVDMELWCSSIFSSAWQTTGRPAENRGADLTNAVTRRWVSFPAQAAVATPPAPWGYRLVLDRPFLVNGQSWMFEFRVFNRQVPQGWSWEIAFGNDYTSVLQEGVQPYGSACAVEPVYYAHAIRAQVGGVLSGWAAGIVAWPSSLLVDVAFLLGLSNTNWGGTSLPLDLTAVGMPRCTLEVAPLVVFPGVRRAPNFGPAGDAFSIRLPGDPALLGGTLFVQALAGPYPGGRWTPSGLITSRPVAITLLPPVRSIGHAWVCSPVLGIRGPAQEVGVILPDQGLVTRVEYQ